MGPNDALRRIAYLLEASAAETYKVRAFRTAATVVDTTAPDRLADLAARGRLSELKGVGDTTARVIAETLETGTASYLTALEAERAPSPTGRQAELRAALAGDCHSHSLWSDGGSPIEEMAVAAASLGHRYLAMTDHSPRLTVAHGLDRTRLLLQLDEVERLNDGLAPFRILTGIEVDILEDGALDQDEDLLARLDVVVASVHSKLSMDADRMTRRMVRAIQSPHTDILGHCTGRKVVGRGRAQSSFDAAAVFGACAATGTAVEINSRPERRDPPIELLTQALDAGCMLSIDTDAHAPGQLEWLTIGCEIATQADVPEERIVNTWEMDRLLDWTASHAA